MAQTRVGYASGTTENPTRHNRGNHNETVQIESDLIFPCQIVYSMLYYACMNRLTFEHLVAQTLDELRQAFQDKLDNAEVTVEDWPDRATLRLAGARYPASLLGFYHGVPQTKRTHNYGLVLPDKINIYRRPIRS